MRASRSKKPRVGSRGRAKRPGVVKVRKAGAGAEKRGATKAGAAKRVAGGKQPPQESRSASARAKSRGADPVPSMDTAQGTAERAAPQPPPVIDRGSPPPLPSPIASFNF